ncbi:MAG TPA: hypothetical protein IGS52_06000 [Oscillatoriaceae cyanobacterium M33_DOE_052]|uniref:Uncharacterized protein n=1 Tax=Planktothricoides sp. SpSt-374 TaxID=2282167 RepID=A0A7C3ZJC5_9CYAN|nr:hypothetical protein [Oscillatoriaceae cyanobacterium M33_DOE_052]
MAYLLYNGVKIKITAQRVSVTDIYRAAGKPPNKSPLNFQNSEAGNKRIKQFQQQQGADVWQSGLPKVEAIVPLACYYLRYLGDRGAAVALQQVYETGRNIEYATPGTTYAKFSSYFKGNQKNANILWWCFIISILIGVAILPQCQSSQPQEEPPSTPGDRQFI